MRIQNLTKFLFEGVVALTVICFSHILVAGETIDENIVEVSVTGINGNYDEYIKKFCTLSDDVITVPEAFGKDCTEGGFFDPAAGTKVILKNAAGEIVQTKETDSNGKCSFSGLPHGQYYAEVTAMRPSALTGKTEKIVYRASNFYPEAGMYKDKIEIDGRYFVAEIRGRIVDAAGKGVKDVSVCLVGNNSRGPSFDIKPIEWKVTTDVSGNYTITISETAVDLFRICDFIRHTLQRESTWFFRTLYHVEAGDGVTQVGIGKPFFVLTEEMIHYTFTLIKTLPDKSILFRTYGISTELLDKKRKYPSVPKSKGHVLFLPDIVLEKVQETTAE